MFLTSSYLRLECPVNGYGEAVRDLRRYPSVPVIVSVRVVAAGL